jgi:hypothetical protein
METTTTAILQMFLTDGWTVLSDEAGRALAYKTETVLARITNLTGTDLPTSDTDWMLTYTDSEDGETRRHTAPKDQPWLTIQDAISFLPSYNLICNACGSDDVVCDAAARWNPDEGQWEISSTFDDRNCEACGAEGSGILKSVMYGANLLTTHEAG